MTDLIIGQTRYTPNVEFYKSGRMLIKGRSLPFSEVDFYIPLKKWVSNFMEKSVDLTINLEILNSASIRMIADLLKTLFKSTHIKNVKIDWYFEEGDEDTHDIGKIFKNKYKLFNFNLIKFVAEDSFDRNYYHKGK